MELREGSLDWVASAEGPGLVSTLVLMRASILTLELVLALVLVASVEAMLVLVEPILVASLLDPQEVMLLDLLAVTEDSPAEV